MPKLNGITANPTTIGATQTSTITVSATPDADRVLRVVGKEVESGLEAETKVTVKAPALRFVLDPAQAKAGDILVTAPDGGTLSATSTPGVFIFQP
jgi:hypothetical protein